MSDGEDAEFEEWLRTEVDDAARHLEYGDTIPLSGDELRRLLESRRTEWIARRRAGSQIEQEEVTDAVADAMRSAQPSKVAPPEWRDQVLDVLTESGSRYLIDTVNWTLRRVRGRDLQEDPEVAPASHLRRDGETLKLLRVISLEVGASAVLDLAPLRPDALWTRRTTTYVISIRRVR